MSEITTVPELAAAAAQEIRTRGWHQGWYGNDQSQPGTCSVCVLGAMRSARTGSPFLWSEEDGAAELAYALRDEIMARVGIDADEWNDQLGRTADEVLEVLDSIAAGGGS